MSQEFVKNTKYDVLTPYGWENFEGVVKTKDSNKEMRTIYTSNGSSIKCTLDHKFYSNGEIVSAKYLKLDDILEDNNAQEIRITDIVTSYNDTVYDIFNTDSHHILTNNIHTLQCDELAFTKPKVAREFWASVFPTLSCLSPSTYVLTGNGFRRISDYFEGNEKSGEYFKIIDEKVAGKEGIEEISHGYVSPSSKTYIITTMSGYKVEVTPNHGLYTMVKGSNNFEMISAEKQQTGNYLQYFLSTHQYGTYSMDQDEAYKMGLRFTDIELPESIMMSNRDTQRNFIAGLYDGNGHDNNDIILDKLSYEVLYQVKLLLANMGIPSILDKASLIIISADKCIFLKSIPSKYFDTLISYDDSSIVEKHWDMIIDIEESYCEVTYDFTVPGTHTFLQNGLLGSNTGGRCIITSTPSDDETLFAELWNNAIKTTDENGIEYEGGVGVNGFKALRVPWNEHPERGEDYKRMQIAQYGIEKFRREHELEFISMEETLIDPVYLSNMKGIDPIAKTGTIRWYKKIDKSMMYVIGYDPSLGTGGDNSAIVIYEFPTLIQVGEWIHNKSDPETQVKVLKTILDMFKEQDFSEDQIFWSLENNSIGEAPLLMIRELEQVHDVELFGEFMKEPRVPGKGRKKRKGFNTDHQSKIRACSRFKMWLESGKMTVHSKPLVAELKGFVSHSRTYKARPGDKDDIVMATLLVVRMVEILMQDEDEYMNELGVSSDDLSDDDDYNEGGWRDPMPIL